MIGAVRAPLALLLLATALAACGHDGDHDGDDASTETTADEEPSTTTTLEPGFCTDLADFYAANGAFFLTVSSGDATADDLDEVEVAIDAMAAEAPATIADDAEVVAASLGGLVDALRDIDLTDTDAVAALLIDSSDDEAIEAADRLDAYAVDECGFEPEDAATPG